MATLWAKSATDNKYPVENLLKIGFPKRFQRDFSLLERFSGGPDRACQATRGFLSLAGRCESGATVTVLAAANTHTSVVAGFRGFLRAAFPARRVLPVTAGLGAGFLWRGRLVPSSVGVL